MVEATSHRRKPSLHLWSKILGSVVVLYLLLFVGIWAAMFQPPEVFGRVMSKLPEPLVFVLFPFKPMWLFARSGHLKVGDLAPDFSLQTLDKKSRVQLSSFRGQRPVVLVFGSYT
jgi:hypothetical protein